MKNAPKGFGTGHTLFGNKPVVRTARMPSIGRRPSGRSRQRRMPSHPLRQGAPPDAVDASRKWRWQRRRTLRPRKKDAPKQQAWFPQRRRQRPRGGDRKLWLTKALRRPKLHEAGGRSQHPTRRRSTQRRQQVGNLRPLPPGRTMPQRQSGAESPRWQLKALRPLNKRLLDGADLPPARLCGAWWGKGAGSGGSGLRAAAASS
jgi:hypothetical protein